MPFKTIAKFGKKKNQVEIPVGIETEIKIPAVIEERLNLSESVSTVIKSRRSTRSYNKKEVDMDLILKVLEAGRYAPSAGNYQPWEFIVVRNPEIKKYLVEACYNQNWMLEAPVFIVVCTNARLAGAIYGERGLKLYGVQGTAAAIENMLLMAESLGLASCWVGTFSEMAVGRLLECPEYVRPCAIITLGYSSFKTNTPPRQKMQEFVHIEKFGNTLLMEKVIREKKPTYMKFRG